MSFNSKKLDGLLILHVSCLAAHHDPSNLYPPRSWKWKIIPDALMIIASKNQTPFSNPCTLFTTAVILPINIITKSNLVMDIALFIFKKICFSQ